VTQYALVKARRPCDFLKSVAELDEPFFEIAAKKIFPTFSLSQVFIIDVDGKDIDKLFTDAQFACVNEKLFNSTDLKKIITQVLKVSDEIVFWYGSEYDDLDDVSDSDTLSEILENVVQTSTCEAYIRFKRKLIR